MHALVSQSVWACMMGTDFAKEINKLEDPGAD